MSELSDGSDDGGELAPEEGENEEAQMEVVPIPMGQPDPNNGPRRTDWAPLLDAHVSLYHVKVRLQWPHLGSFAIDF